MGVGVKTVLRNLDVCARRDRFVRTKRMMRGVGINAKIAKIAKGSKGESVCGGGRSPA